MEQAGKFDMSVFDDVADISLTQFLNPELCKGFVIRRLHPDGFTCPRCRAGVHDPKRVDRLMLGERIECSTCRKRFSAITGTVLSGTHMDFTVFFMLLWLIRQGFPAVRIAKILTLDPTTARAWMKKLEVLT